jgi:hypothetical protein
MPSIDELLVVDIKAVDVKSWYEHCPDMPVAPYTGKQLGKPGELMSNVVFHVYEPLMAPGTTMQQTHEGLPVYRAYRIT